MSDRARLEEWFAKGTLSRPGHERPDFVDLVRALAHCCGVDDLPRPPESIELETQIGAHEHYVFVLVDGVGTQLLKDLNPGGFLSAHTVWTLQPVFPSTTAAAITSLATGQYPARHGATGWWIYLPEIAGIWETLPFWQRWTRKPLSEWKLRVEDLLPEPRLLPRFKRRTLTVKPADIAHSAYSTFFTAGTPCSGYDTYDTAADLIVKHAYESPAPSYTYCYMPKVDSNCHDHGVESPEAKTALHEADAALAKLHERLRGHARLIVTADHGHVTIPEVRRCFIRHDEALAKRLIVPPSGEPQVPMFHVKSNEHDAFEKEFRERFGEYFALITRKDAEDLRLFGPEPLSERSRLRIGDFLAIPPEPTMLVYVPEDGKTHILTGGHAGLTPSEMHVPLVLA